MVKYSIGISIHHWLSTGHSKVFKFRIQCWPPLPKGFNIWIMFSCWYWSTFTYKMWWVIMRCTCWPCTFTFCFCHPRWTILRRTITTTKITSTIKVYFYITWCYVLIPRRIFYCFKVLDCPRLTWTIVPIAKFSIVFHCPTITTFWGTWTF